MSLFFHQVFTLVWKDFKTEIRTKERLSAMCFFALLVILIFNFAFKPEPEDMNSAASGVFWVTVTFSGLLGLTRSFSIERQNDCLVGLRLCPADPSAIYLGKMIGNFLTMALMEAIVLPMLILFMNLTVWDNFFRLLLPLAFGNLGFVAIGTLFAAISINSRFQETLLPMLALPVLVPALLATMESFRAVLAGDPFSEIDSWLRIGGVFALLFVTICVILFEYVLEE